MKKVLCLVFVLLKLCLYSQNASESSKIIEKINSIFREYYFSEGQSDVEKFKLSGTYVLAISKTKYYKKNQDGTKTLVKTTTFASKKFNLSNVAIINGGRVATGAGLEICCYHEGKCILSKDYELSEPYYDEWVVYPIKKQEVIEQLVTEFARLKYILGL